MVEPHECWAATAFAGAVPAGRLAHRLHQRVAVAGQRVPRRFGRDPITIQVAAGPA